MHPLLLSLLAGLSTTIGGSVVFCFPEPTPAMMAFTLALAAGVMTSVSVLELMKPVLSGSLEPIFWSVAGAAAFKLLTMVLPEDGQSTLERPAIKAKTSDEMEAMDAERGSPSSKGSSQPRTGPDKASPKGAVRKRNDPTPPQSPPRHPAKEPDDPERARQLRLGLLMMMTLTAHNLPEGVAVAVGALSSHHTGLVVSSAIAMHNIPEGLAIAVPIFAATGERWKAIAMTLASGLSEPLGACLGLLVLQPFLTQRLLENAVCAVGGIMIACSVLELWPEARKYHDNVAMAIGFLAGWAAIYLTIGYTE